MTDFVKDVYLCNQSNSKTGLFKYVYNLMSPLPYIWKMEKVPWIFWKSALFLCMYGLNCHNAVLRKSWRNSTEISLCWALWNVYRSFPFQETSSASKISWLRAWRRWVFRNLKLWEILFQMLHINNIIKIIKYNIQLRGLGEVRSFVFWEKQGITKFC